MKSMDIRALNYIAANPHKIREELARRQFVFFLQYIAPQIKLGWWNREVCQKLQKFYEDLISGKKPILLIQAPPQHGKSTLIVYFLAWLAGKNPDLRKIYTSYSERLGIRANLQLQRIYDSQKYKSVFPDTILNASNVVTASGQFLRNREVLEYVNKGGYFRNTTVRGSITGESLDVGIVDDPIKGREEANSETIRQKTWDWLMDDFFSRFSEMGGLLGIMTRWHVDDPFGRLLDAIDSIPELGTNIEVYSRPAIALEDEEYRNKGEALFPELKSLEFLLTRRALMTAGSWASLYQQMPFIQGGGLFKVENMQIVNFIPELVGEPVRYWDKAGTEDGGAYTAGVKMQETKEGKFIVLDVIRKQMSPYDRENRIKQTASMDERKTNIWIEQEPGSAGKESADNTIRNLKGFKIYADKVTGAKEDRAEPYAAQVEGGNVLLLKAKWNKAFIDEHELFPGKYKDQVDAAGGAFSKIVNKPLIGFTDKQKSDITKRRRQSRNQGKQW